jgi:hypothetical protein
MKAKKQGEKKKVNLAKLLGVKPYLLSKKIAPAIQKQNHQESWFFSIMNHLMRCQKTKKVAHLKKTCQFFFICLLSKSLLRSHDDYSKTKVK